MGYWNYRVCYEDIAEDKRIYNIYEVVYEKNGTVHSIANLPASPYGETLEDLHSNIALFQLALKHPPIDLNSVLQDLQVVQH